MARAPIVSTHVWRLGARPDAIDWSARIWREVAREADQARELAAGVVAVSTVAADIAGTVDEAADVIRLAQSHLDKAWWRLRRCLAAGGSPVTLVGGRVVFRPTNQADTKAVRAAIEEAVEIQARADARLSALAGRLDGLRQRLRADQLAPP